QSPAPVVRIAAHAKKKRPANTWVLRCCQKKRWRPRYLIGHRTTIFRLRRPSCFVTRDPKSLPYTLLHLLFPPFLLKQHTRSHLYSSYSLSLCIYLPFCPSPLLPFIRLRNRSEKQESTRILESTTTTAPCRQLLANHP